jgi:hypothetical protein
MITIYIHHIKYAGPGDALCKKNDVIAKEFYRILKNLSKPTATFLQQQL